MKQVIKIGNAGGFWGDDLGALKRQLTGGELDYISIDYLAEITMSILRKQQIKNPQYGYVADFVNQIVEVAPMIKAKGVRILTNAGGINPLACAKKIIQELSKSSINLKIAVVEGDNIIDQIDSFYPSQTDFKNMETGHNFADIKGKLQSANVYLGIAPLIKALETDADIIIAGRVTDTSITMAPLIYEFGWKLNDWDKIASSLVAGHIIECGAQATGGNFTDWQLVKTWNEMGYPIVEAYPDGTFTVTKHPGTGGLVTIDTVKEQLVYEMGSPSNYISPDVVVDFRSIRLNQDGSDRVKVSGIKGKPATRFLKVSMAYHDGYKATSSIIISGDQALAKAQKFKSIFWDRLGINFMKHHTEFVGYDACHKNLAQPVNPNEILLRFSVYDTDQNKINEFGKSIAPLILTGPPGVAVTGGRPSPQEVMTYYPTLIPKVFVKSTVSVLDSLGQIVSKDEIPADTGFEEDMHEAEEKLQISLEVKIISDYPKDGCKLVKLRQICLARSGDKGDTSNIGVIARSEPIYQFLRKMLTADYVKSKFSELCKGKVIRYELDNLTALNFLLEESLDGGGTKSLMIDAQGKTFASALLNQEMYVPSALIITNNS